MGLAFGVVDGGGMDEDTEDISLTLHSSTIGMHSLDDSDNESSEFDAVQCIGRTLQHVGMLWGITVQQKMQWSKNHYARSLLFCI